MTTPLRLRGFIEELQDYIAANYSDSDGRTYTTATNFTIGNFLDVEDLDRILGSDVDLTIYDQAIDVTKGARRHRTTRAVRFVFKDSHAQASLNRAHAMTEWLSGLERIGLPLFVAWVHRFQRMPGIITGRSSGTFLSDLVVHFLTVNRT